MKKGQALIEFIIILPILLLLMFGVSDYVRIALLKSDITSLLTDTKELYKEGKTIKEIEEFIYTHPKVKDVQVIGVPDAQYGEEIMACIILNDGETMTEEELKEYVLSHMAKHKVPRYVNFVDSFPMNAAGKILKYKMREAAVDKLGLHKASKIVTA